MRKIRKPANVIWVTTREYDVSYGFQIKTEHFDLTGGSYSGEKLKASSDNRVEPDSRERISNVVATNPGVHQCDTLTVSDH